MPSIMLSFTEQYMVWQYLSGSITFCILMSHSFKRRKVVNLLSHQTGFQS